MDEDTIEIKIAGLLQTYFGMIDFKMESVKLLVALLFPLFKKNPLVVRLLQSILYSLRGDYSSVWDLLSPLIELFIHLNKDNETDSMPDNI